MVLWGWFERQAFSEKILNVCFLALVDLTFAFFSTYRGNNVAVGTVPLCDVDDNTPRKSLNSNEQRHKGNKEEEVSSFEENATFC